MKPCELQKMLSREWHEAGQYKTPNLPLEARVVTGSYRHDAHIHRIMVEYGIEVYINTKFTEIENYRVVDEKKFAWFLLRWA